MLGTLKFYLRGQGNDPYERQKEAADRREEQTRLVLGRLGPLRRAGFGRLLKWAQSAAPVREDAQADIGLAWPLLRRMLLELGRRLSAAGVIEEPDDVFWLHSDELTAAAATAAAPAGSALPRFIREPGGRRVRAQLADAVEQRKTLWRGQRKGEPAAAAARSSG